MTKENIFFTQGLIKKNQNPFIIISCFKGKWKKPVVEKKPYKTNDDQEDDFNNNDDGEDLSDEEMW